MTLLTLLSQQGAEPPVIAPQYFGGAAWVWPKSRRDRRYIDDAPEALPEVETPAPPRAKLSLPVAQPFDVQAALEAARKAVKGIAAQEVALRRDQRRSAAVALANARNAAMTQARAIAQMEADDEDDIEAIIMGAW